MIETIIIMVILATGLGAGWISRGIYEEYKWNKLAENTMIELQKEREEKQ